MTSPLPVEVEQYLRRLRLSLAALPEGERDEIVAEIRSHLEERQRRGASALLDGFDPPEVYASHFLSERALADALARGTSLALGRALLVGVRESLLSVLVVVPVALGMFVGVGLIACALLKPFFPAKVGLFCKPHGNVFFLGFSATADGANEILGWWAIPAFLVTGVLVLWAGNRALRALARRRLRGAEGRRPAG
jgi:uncharacterized membrane protein